MTQVADYKDFVELIKRVEVIEEENTFLRTLLLGERWLNRKQTMDALGCKQDKLRQLTLENKLTFRYDGKYPFYEAFSIRTYLMAQKIDAKVVDSRIIKARFTA